LIGNFELTNEKILSTSCYE